MGSKSKAARIEGRKKSLEELLEDGRAAINVKAFTRKIFEVWGGMDTLAGDMHHYFVSKDTGPSGKAAVMRIIAQFVTNPAAQEADEADVSVYDDDELIALNARLLSESAAFREEMRKRLAEHDERERIERERAAAESASNAELLDPER